MPDGASALQLVFGGDAALYAIVALSLYVSVCAVVLAALVALPFGAFLALVQTGDRIRLDVPKRSIELLVDEVELTRRAALFVAPPAHEGSDRGYSWLFQQHVTQADEGCDFDFLQSKP